MQLCSISYHVTKLPGMRFRSLLHRLSPYKHLKLPEAPTKHDRKITSTAPFPLLWRVRATHRIMANPAPNGLWQVRLTITSNVKVTFISGITSWGRRIYTAANYFIGEIDLINVVHLYGGLPPTAFVCIFTYMLLCSGTSGNHSTSFYCLLHVNGVLYDICV